MTEPEEQSLHDVLADLIFPAQRWEILTAADLYGADALMLDRLHRLPAHSRPYRDVHAIVEALESIPHQVPRHEPIAQPRRLGGIRD